MTSYLIDFSYKAVQNNYNQLVTYLESFQAITIVFVFWYNKWNSSLSSIRNLKKCILNEGGGGNRTGLIGVETGSRRESSLSCGAEGIFKESNCTDQSHPAVRYCLTIH